MEKKNKAGILAIVAGLILITAGISGEGMWIFFRDMLGLVVDNVLLDYLFLALITIASLGGLAVIIGGALIFGNRIGSGKLFVALGTGLGVIGIIIAFAVWFIGGSSPLTISFILGIIGVAFSIYARKQV